MIPAQNIAVILGLDKAKHKKLRTSSELRRLVDEGLPKTTGLYVLSYLFDDKTESQVHLFQIVPAATFKRRQKLLKASESEKIERLARVIATADYVWNGDRSQARLFMLSPNSMLDGETPYDVAMSELGAREVEEILWKVFYGISA